MHKEAFMRGVNAAFRDVLGQDLNDLNETAMQKVAMAGELYGQDPAIEQLLLQLLQQLQMQQAAPQEEMPPEMLGEGAELPPEMMGGGGEEMPPEMAGAEDVSMVGEEAGSEIPQEAQDSSADEGGGEEVDEGGENPLKEKSEDNKESSKNEKSAFLSPMGGMMAAYPAGVGALTAGRGSRLPGAVLGGMAGVPAGFAGAGLGAGAGMALGAHLGPKYREQVWQDKYLPSFMNGSQRRDNEAALQGSALGLAGGAALGGLTGATLGGAAGGLVGSNYIGRNEAQRQSQEAQMAMMQRQLDMMGKQAELSNPAKAGIAAGAVGVAGAAAYGAKKMHDKAKANRAAAADEKMRKESPVSYYMNKATTKLQNLGK